MYIVVAVAADVGVAATVIGVVVAVVAVVGVVGGGSGVGGDGLVRTMVVKGVLLVLPLFVSLLTY